MTSVSPTKNAQVIAFSNEWYPYAQQAGKQLGIPASWVLSQWGMESNWGQQPTGTNNVAGILTKSASGNYVGQNFASPADFVSSYVNAVKSDFTWYTQGNNTNNQGTALTTPYDLFSGNINYSVSDTGAQYGSKVQGAFQTLQSTITNATALPSSLSSLKSSLTSRTVGYSAPTGSIVTGSGGIVTNPASLYGSANSPGWLTQVLYGAAGIALVIIGVVFLVSGSKTGKMIAGVAGKVVTK